MNTPLTNDLLGQLRGQPLADISNQLGLSPSQTENAVSAALPLLLGALGRNASQPQGAEALFGALQRDHAGLDIGSVLGSVLGGGGQGGSILGHVLGGRQQNAAQGLGVATGLGQVLAPLVMAYLARRMFAGNAGGSGLAASPQQLGDVLGQERQSIAQQGGVGGSLMGAVLDRDGDGDTDFSDLIGLAGSFLGGGRR
jgi:hypothetical protein